MADQLWAQPDPAPSTIRSALVAPVRDFELAGFRQPRGPTIKSTQVEATGTLHAGRRPWEGSSAREPFKCAYTRRILWYMPDAVVPVRMSKTLTRALDDLVEGGLYSSRNEALKDAVRSLVERKRAMGPESREVLGAELKAIGDVATALILEEGGPAISRVILFGSVARGQPREGSDIDLFVVLKGGDRHEWRGKLLGALMPVIYRLGRYISLKTFTEREVKEASEKGSAFIQEVIETGIQLYPKGGSSGPS